MQANPQTKFLLFFGLFILTGLIFAHVQNVSTRSLTGSPSTAPIPSSNDVFTSQWALALGYPSNEENLRIIRNSPDGNYVVAGSLVTEGFGRDIWVLKLSPYGDILWQKAIRAENLRNIMALDVTEEGNILLAGTSFAEQNLAWIIMLDSGGQRIWHTVIENVAIFAAIESSTQSILAVGQVELDNGTLNPVLISLSPDGSILSSQSLNAVQDQSALSIIEISNGDLYVSGTIQGESSEDVDIWIARLSYDRTILWQQSWGGSYRDNFHDMTATLDDGVTVVAALYSNALLSDPWVLKVRGDGQTVWQKRYIGSVQQDVFNSIIKRNNDDYIIAGHLESTTRTFVILQLNEDGETISNVLFSSDEGDISPVIDETDENEILLAGTRSDARINGEHDGWVLKLDSTGTIPQCSLSQTVDLELHDVNVASEDLNMVVASLSISLTEKNLNIDSVEVPTQLACFATNLPANDYLPMLLYP